MNFVNWSDTKVLFVIFMTCFPQYCKQNMYVTHNMKFYCSGGVGVFTLNNVRELGIIKKNKNNNPKPTNLITI